MGRLTDEQLQILAGLAAKATPGPWTWEDDPPTLYSGRLPNQHGLNLLGRLDPDWNGQNNLDFICAANPTVISLLVQEVMQARIKE